MAASYLRIAYGTEDLIRGTVVPIQAVLRDNTGLPVLSGVFTGNNALMHVHDPNWTIVASGVILSNQGSNGVLSHDWDSPGDSVEGWYTAIAFWADGGSKRIAQRLFRLTDTLE